MKQYSPETLRTQIHEYIHTLGYKRQPEGLYEPIEYVLGMGGKRLRPVLLLLAYNLYRGDVERAFPQAAGIETYHNFTLLHDDLMDKADKRRGCPTVHKKWNENTAILSGDAMLILAYRYMLQGCEQAHVHDVAETFSRVAIEVCEGQQWDMEFEHRNDVTIREYVEMIRLKTSVLLAGALKIGAILADAPREDAQALYDFGMKAGVAFQLQDDYLDVYGNSEVFGKNIGGDILCNKKTFMLLTAFDSADEATRRELTHWMTRSDFNPQEKISAVTAIYKKVGVGSICETEIARYYSEAKSCLGKVNVPNERKQYLIDFMQSLMNRKW